MRKPRELASTFPSPSEMDNYHKCPAFWYLKDRLWISPMGERWPLAFGKIVDKVLGRFLEMVIGPAEVLSEYWVLVGAVTPDIVDDYFESYAASTADALTAWLTKYGEIARREDVVEIQPTLTGQTKAKIDYVVRTGAGLRIRERKLVTPFVDIEDEIAKYELGLQPLCYYAVASDHYKERIECVEMEFLIRSAPAKGRYKEKQADARRHEIFVDGWKKDLWYNTALYTNECMRMLEENLERDGEIVTFAAIPRHTRNCLQKLGNKVYECDFYKCCKNNTTPLALPDYFNCDRTEEAAHVESVSCPESGGVRSEPSGTD